MSDITDQKSTSKPSGKKRGRKPGRPKLKKQKPSGGKYESIHDNLFAAYYHGHNPKELAEMFDMPLQSVYTLKRRYGWDDRKEKIDELARQKTDIDLAAKKSDIIKMSSVLVAQAGSYLMKHAAKDGIKFSVNDFVNLVKNHQLLTGEVTERYGIYDPDMVKQIVREMSPGERAMVLTLFDKMDKRMKEEQEDKQRHLKIAE